MNQNSRALSWVVVAGNRNSGDYYHYIGTFPPQELSPYIFTEPGTLPGTLEHITKTRFGVLI